MDRGEYRRAIDSFLELAHLVSQQPPREAVAASFYVQAHDGLLEAGGLLLDEGAAAEAKDALASLIELYPESDDARHNLAIAYLDLRWWQDVLEVGRAMVASQPLSYAAWTFMLDAFAGMAEDAASDSAYAESMQRYDDVQAQFESLPFRLDGLQIAADGTLGGTLLGGVAPEGDNVLLQFRFVGRDGVLAERSVTLTAPGPGEQTTFALPGSNAHVTGWTYTIVE
jgi:tetratricopeptide (TPR) repeat protein